MPKLWACHIGCQKLYLSSDSGHNTDRPLYASPLATQPRAKAQPAWRVERAHKKAARKLEPIHPATDDELNCVHFKRCSGWTLDSSLRSPPELAVARNYFRKKGLAHLGATFGPLHGWRLRARLAVRGTCAKPVIGLYASGTHTATNITDCRSTGSKSACL